VWFLFLAESILSRLRREDSTHSRKRRGRGPSNGALKPETFELRVCVLYGLEGIRKRELGDSTHSRKSPLPPARAGVLSIICALVYPVAMTQDSRGIQEQILEEAQRTTHAVRALARFVIIETTYLVVAAAVLALAFALVEWTFDFVTELIVLALLIALVGVFHSLGAAWSELGMSSRLTLDDDLGESAQTLHTYEARAVAEGPCECSNLERVPEYTGSSRGREFCLRCNRYLDAD